MDRESDSPLGEVVDDYTVSSEATDYDELGPLITNTVAALTGRPPEQVGAELTSCVDVDALNRLFVSSRAENPPSSGVDKLILRIAGCIVTVAPDGTVTVIPADRED